MARDKDVGFFLEWIVSEFGLCEWSDSSVFFFIYIYMVLISLTGDSGWPDIN